MNRKTANIILKVCVAVWIIMSISALCAIVLSDTPIRQNMRYFIQLIMFFLFATWLGIYIWRMLKK